MDSFFKVADKQCDQCLFSRSKIVSNQRKKEILEEVVTEQSYFICHKTDDTCCRGFYNSNLANYSQLLRVAERLGVVKFVPIEGEEDSANVSENSQQQSV